MKTLNLTQEQLDQLSSLVLELPTKYGIPIYNLIASFIQKINSEESVLKDGTLELECLSDSKS